VAAEESELLGWLLNQQHVRTIFDEAQSTTNGIVLAYLVANLTFWMTHSIAFNHLLHLKVALHHAAILHCKEIIAAQFGAEKNKRAAEKLAKAATTQCDVIESGKFWNCLQTVADDIKPICFGTNINQSDKTCPDQVVLTFAGIFHHFNNHPNPEVSIGMKACIEKCWKALEQPMFIFTLILNPYKHLN